MGLENRVLDRYRVIVSRGVCVDSVCFLPYSFIIFFVFCLLLIEGLRATPGRGHNMSSDRMCFWFPDLSRGAH